MTNGYLYVKTEDGGMELEARAVLAGLLGRKLRPGESARFRNGDTLDARPENLVLYRNNVPIDLDDAMRRGPRRKGRPKRSNAYALIEVPEKAVVVRARSTAEAEQHANGTPVIAVSLSRVRKKLREA